MVVGLLWWCSWCGSGDAFNGGPGSGSSSGGLVLVVVDLVEVVMGW